MGLDITAYRKLIAAQGNEAFDESGEPTEEWEQFYVNPDFPMQADDIQNGHCYKSEDTMGFRAGSYGGYNHWREQLTKIAGYVDASAVWNDPKPGPFVELINFSDCEGIIGQKTSSKLAKDFSEFQSKADASPDQYFRDKYAEWRRAFEMAADGGAVRFH